MARSVGKPDSYQKRRPPPKDWREFLPPPAPPGRNLYDPVPIIPDDPDPVIPQFRPAPTWPYGPRHSPEIPDVVPDLKGKIPTLEDLMQRPQIPDRWKIFPPPAAPGKEPFGPVPIMPRSPPPPTWPYGPPYLGAAPTQAPLFGASSSEFVSPQNSTATGGLLGMMARAGVIDPSNADTPPAGGLVALLQDYLRSDRERD
jgi:hypothetical protein